MSCLTKHQPERIVENEILDWLKANQIFAWPNKIGFKHHRRKNGHLKATNGISDIVGIYGGKFMAIEVKTSTGKLSEEQITFLARVREEGGIAIVAKCVEDVEDGLL